MCPEESQNGGDVKKKSLLLKYRDYNSFLLAVLFLLLSGCQAETVHSRKPSVTKVSITRLAVVPFRVIAPSDREAAMLSCPVCGEAFQADRETPPEAEAAVQNLVLQNLRQRQITVITPEETRDAYSRAIFAHQGRQAEALQALGKEAGAEAVLVGYIFRYRERQGRWYSADKPASVTFEFHLLRVSDAAIIWSGSFDRTQASLMENLSQFSFFYRWGFKWVTARELSEEGVREIMKTFPDSDNLKVTR